MPGATEGGGKSWFVAWLEYAPPVGAEQDVWMHGKDGQASSRCPYRLRGVVHVPHAAAGALCLRGKQANGPQVGEGLALADYALAVTLLVKGEAPEHMVRTAIAHAEFRGVLQAPALRFVAPPPADTSSRGSASCSGVRASTGGARASASQSAPAVNERPAGTQAPQMSFKLYAKSCLELPVKEVLRHLIAGQPLPPPTCFSVSGWACPG